MGDPTVGPAPRAGSTAQSVTLGDPPIDEVILPKAPTDFGLDLLRTLVPPWILDKVAEALTQERAATPEEKVSSLRASGIKLTPAVESRLEQFQSALEKEAKVGKAERPRERDPVLERLGLRTLDSRETAESQFALGRLISCVADSVPESATSEFVETALTLAQAHSTQLAAVQLADNRSISVAPRILKDYLTDPDPKISAAALRVSARGDASLTSLASLAQEFGVFDSDDARYDDRRSGYSPEREKRDRIRGLEKLSVRPDLDPPERLDALLLRLILERWGDRDNPSSSLLQYLSMGGRDLSYRAELADVALRFVEQGRLEKPMAVLGELLNENPNPSRILEYVERHPKLAADWSIDDMVGQRNVLLAGKGRFEENIDPRIARIFTERMSQTNPGIKLDGIAPTVLNLLSHVRNEHPDEWRVLAFANKLDTLAGGLAQLIDAEREQLITQDPVIFGKGVKLAGFLHHEARFPEESLRAWAEKFGMDYLGSTRGTENVFANADLKESFLKQVSGLAQDTNSPATVWIGAHGGPSHFYLADGGLESALSYEMHLPNAISFSELASSMVDAQVNAGHKTIDFSHMNFLHDACLQQDFISQFRSEVFKIAEEKGLEVRAMPLQASASQASMPGIAIPFSYFHEELLSRAVTAGDTLRLSDIVAVDRELNKRWERVLSLPAEQTRLPRYGQDPAIFSSAVVPRERIEKILQHCVPKDPILRRAFEQSLHEMLPHLAPVRVDRPRPVPKPWTNEIGFLPTTVRNSHS